MSLSARKSEGRIAMRVRSVPSGTVISGTFCYRLGRQLLTTGRALDQPLVPDQLPTELLESR
jgi:hypothetical protein